MNINAITTLRKRMIAGSYNDALVPIGIVMALLGYVIGTGGGLLVANIMSLF